MQQQCNEKRGSQSVIKRNETQKISLKKDERFVNNYLSRGLAKSRPTVSTIHDNGEKIRTSAKSGNKVNDNRFEYASLSV